MGFLKALLWLFRRDDRPAGRREPSRRGAPTRALADLAARVGADAAYLRSVTPAYRQFEVPKRAGGRRVLLAPSDELKGLQRRLLRRVLAGLKAHPAAKGFERGQSIVTHAACHVGSEMIIHLDIRDFFPSTRAQWVSAYYQAVGWDDEAVEVLTRLTTWQGVLPAGAPTSPRLSNLVNIRMDARLDGLTRALGGRYTRYADDLTFSMPSDGPGRPTRRARNPKTLQPVEFPVSARSFKGAILHNVRRIAREHGYHIHKRRKLRVSLAHQQQRVTGLVVNDKVALPRRTRRWLRAVEHRLRTGGDATLTSEQLAGWLAFQEMIVAQSMPNEESR